MSHPMRYSLTMNNNHTEIVFVLDRSGSMQSCQEAAIAGFNRFLVEQQQLEGLVKLTLVLFDDEYLVPIDALPAAEVLPLDDETYVPRGSTALLDAIGRAVDDLGARLASSPESDRPGAGNRGHPDRRSREFLANVQLASDFRADQAPEREVSVDVPISRRESGCDRDCGANEYRGIERGHATWPTRRACAPAASRLPERCVDCIASGCKKPVQRNAATPLHPCPTSSRRKI